MTRERHTESREVLLAKLSRRPDGGGAGESDAAYAKARDVSPTPSGVEGGNHISCSEETSDVLLVRRLRPLRASSGISTSVGTPCIDPLSIADKPDIG